jgi:hypothetical protein
MHIPFQTIDWTTIEKEVFKGETGAALSQTIEFAGLRIRLVEYSAGYTADHWCQKGHIVYCVEGEFATELSTGVNVALQKGDAFVVSNDLSSHRTVSEKGAKIFIVDGDFLKSM